MTGAKSVKQPRVSRLPPLPDPLPPDVAALFEERLKKMGRILNLHHVLAHAPKLSKASAQVAFALRYETSTRRLYIELAIVRAGMNANGKYEVQQHKPMLLAEGFPLRKFNALAKWRSKVKALSSRFRCMRTKDTQSVKLTCWSANFANTSTASSSSSASGRRMVSAAE